MEVLALVASVGFCSDFTVVVKIRAEVLVVLAADGFGVICGVI